MRKVLLLLIAASIFGACRLATSIEMKATVATRIAQTQTAVVQQIASPTALSFAVLPTLMPPVQPTPEPLVLGGKEKVLLQISKCTPPEQPDCVVTPLGVYLAQADGSQQSTVADKAIFIGVDPQGEQCLIQPLTEGGVSTSLVVVSLQDQTQKTLTESYAADYPCDSNRCGAIWLKDGKRIGLILKQKNVNYLDEKNIYLIQSDSLEQKQLTQLGVDAPPMFLYQVNSAEFIYWEKDDQGIMGGTFSVSIDGGKIAEIPLGVEKAFSPAGNLVAFQKKVNDLGYQTALIVAKLDGSEEKAIYTPQEGDELKDYVWSPDGTQLVFDVSRCNPDCVPKRYLWKAGDEQPKELSLPAGILLRAPVWSPNGKFLLFITYDVQGKKYNYWASQVESGQWQPMLTQLNLPLGVFVDSIAVLP